MTIADLLPAEIHLTVPRTASRRRAGVRLHTARLSDDEIAFRQGLPVTTLPRGGEKFFAPTLI